LNPKKAKTYYKKTAEELDLSEELVKDVLSFFWTDVRRSMSAIKYPSINVPGLGVFRLNLVKLEAEIDKYECYIRAIGIPKTLSKYATLKEAEKRLAVLKEMREYVKNERAEEAEFRKNKKMGNIIKIWKNKGKIMEGIKNKVFQKDHIEAIAKERMEICNSCPNIDKTGSSCVLPGSQPCCSMCGCTLSLKTRSLSSGCDNNFWTPVLSEEESDALTKQLEDEETKD